MILNYLPISAYSSLLEFDMFVNIARLDIGQLFTQSVCVCGGGGGGASIYFGHISSSQGFPIFAPIFWLTWLNMTEIMWRAVKLKSKTFS